MKNPVQKKNLAAAQKRGESARDKINPALVEMAKLLARIAAERDYRQHRRNTRNQ